MSRDLSLGCISDGYLILHSTPDWCSHDDVIKLKHFPRYWPFLRGIHRSSVNSRHKGQWRGALMLSLICVWIKGWVNNREAGDLRRYRTQNVVIVMFCCDGSTMIYLIVSQWNRDLSLLWSNKYSRWSQRSCEISRHFECLLWYLPTLFILGIDSFCINDGK